MKIIRPFFLAFLCILVSHNSYSQSDGGDANDNSGKTKEGKKKDKGYKSDFVIDQSLLAPQDSIDLVIEQNSNVRITFRNVNTFLYKAEFKEIQHDMINGAEVENNTIDINNQLKNIQIKEINMKVPVPEGGSDATLLYLNKIDKKSKEIDAIAEKVQEQGDKIAQFEEENEDLDKEAKANLLKMEESLGELEEKHDALLEEYASLLNDGNTVEVLQIVKMTHFNDLFFQYRMQLIEINNLTSVYFEFAKLLYSQKPYPEIEAEKEKLLEEYFGSKDDNKAIVACKNRLEKLENLYSEMIKVYSQIPDKSKLKDSFTQLESFHAQINRASFNELINEISRILYAITEENWTLSFQTSKVSDKADRIAYSFKFKPVKNDFNHYSVPKSFDYILPVTGGWKFDISAGLMWHFNLMDDELRLVTQSDSTTKLVNDKVETSIIPVAAALLNVYWRSDRNVKLALNAGMGTNTQDLYYYFGGGILLGRSERVGINFGAVLGQLKLMSTEYQDGQIINQPISELDVNSFYQPSNQWKTGFFIGVTYNLTGSNKDEVDKMVGGK